MLHFLKKPYICPNCLQYFSHWSQSISRRRIWHHGARRVYSTPTQSHQPFRLAIIGSGPAGFYAAGRLMRGHSKIVIDMYERLPIPFGLVRYGVAPDHPEVKNCEERFEEIAQSPNFNFIGNVNIGRDIPLSSLKPHYDAILFAYGASTDRELGIPGEHLNGVYSARSFVAWYNGLPGSTNLQPKLDAGDQAVVIGQGNVALDVARILLSGVDKLRNTDIPKYALDALSKSTITSVHVVGRRGPMQAAFTIKEIRELVQLPDVYFPSILPSLFPDDLNSLPRPRRRIAELLIKSGKPESAAPSFPKRFQLDFLLKPTSFSSSPTSPTQLATVSFQPTQYTDPTTLFSAAAAVQTNPTLPSESLPASLVLRSIGYKASPLPGFSDLQIPFDTQRGIIPNHGGRVLREHGLTPAIANTPELAHLVPGVYVAGWVKRGPTGVIASTMEDAFQTADAVLADWGAGRKFLNDGRGTGLGWEGVKGGFERNGGRWTEWMDWRVIDQVERERGRASGKTREKITEAEEMLRVLGK